MIKSAFFIVYRTMCEGQKRNEKSNNAFFAMIIITLILYINTITTIVTLEKLLRSSFLNDKVFFGGATSIGIICYFFLCHSKVYLRLDEEYKEKEKYKKVLIKGVSFFIISFFYCCLMILISLISIN